MAETTRLVGEQRGRGLPRTVTADTLGRGRTWKPFLEPSGSTGGAPSGTALKQAEGTWTQTETQSLSSQRVDWGESRKGTLLWLMNDPKVALPPFEKPLMRAQSQVCILASTYSFV